MEKLHDTLVEELYSFINTATFPCVVARNLAERKKMHLMVAGHLECPRNDGAILDFIHRFSADLRMKENAFYSAAVIFTNDQCLSEEDFDRQLWNRLKALRQKDAEEIAYDSRVSPDPSSIEYSFSLAGEAFFVLALHPGSSRSARRFKRPVLIFNPHAQFEEMRRNGTYDKIKTIVRKRDIIFAGSVNPMLTDFGTASEALQYSGRVYDKELKCPRHANNNP